MVVQATTLSGAARLSDGWPTAVSCAEVVQALKARAATSIVSPAAVARSGGWGRRMDGTFLGDVSLDMLVRLAPVGLAGSTLGR